MKYNYPNQMGFFGIYGGRQVPLSLEKRLKALETAYLKLASDKDFLKEFEFELNSFANRPSSLYLTKKFLKNPKIKLYLKREDLNHTGAHKINNAIGQALLAKRMGKKFLIAETGAGQHGVATATVAAKYGMKCQIFMGARDIINQKMNVNRMKLLGAEVIEVDRGQGTLKDAVDEALTAYMTNDSAYYLLGSAVGPHPYPVMVRNFQSIIGIETKRQIIKLEGKLPDLILACVGGGSNAIGIYHEFIKENGVRLIAAEAAGKGENSNRHALTLLKGSLGEIHGYKCKVLVNEDGTIAQSYSAASGLDYPGVGPELSLLKDLNRLEVMAITDLEAVNAFKQLAKTEGIIPALESAHALAAAIKISKTLKNGSVMVVNLSGRGDKDVETVSKIFSSSGTDTISNRHLI